MRIFGKWLGRVMIGLLVLIAVLLAPVIWVETSCRGSAVSAQYAAIVTDPAEQRPESRTFLTYPEWHIVHAYDDYARVIRDSDPHDYGFLRGITGFWSSLCAVSEISAEHGGFARDAKQTIYTIGVSFTAELAMKALYEETIGRITTLLRGPEHSALDTVSAKQAADYATFLQQVPWYKWNFHRDIETLKSRAGSGLRDRERRFALGVEYGVKAAYAQLIKAAVASVGPDRLTLRLIVDGIDATDLSAIDGIEVIKTHPQGIEIQTPRYRELTHILDRLARQGAQFIEIAGNDDIMLTLTSDAPYDGALFSFRRQGYDDYRHLLALNVTDLATILRSFETGPARLEHIHDY